MPSRFEEFWTFDRYAFVGNSKVKPFPVLSFRNTRKLGKTVYPVDPSGPEIDGQRAFPDLASLPEKVDAVVLETPKEETLGWVEKAADAGVQHVWIHMKRDTPEALALAQERGLDVRHGTCAVQYVTPGFSVHAIHRFFRKMAGQY